MASVTISNLHPVGTELFFDSESYMTELSEGEVNVVQGGSTFGLATAIAVTVAAVGVGISYAAAAVDKVLKQ